MKRAQLEDAIIWVAAVIVSFIATVLIVHSGIPDDRCAPPIAHADQAACERIESAREEGRL